MTPSLAQVDLMRQHGSSALGRWRRAVSDRLLLALIAGTAALVLWYALDLAGSATQVVAAWLFIAVIHTGLTWVARSTAQAPALGAPTRRFWRAIAVAGVIYLVGDVAQAITAARDPVDGTSATGAPVQLITLSLGSGWLMLTLLPYGAIAVTYGLLTVAMVRDVPATMAIALAGAAVSTLLVVLRQLAAFRDNARLLGELDGKVRELRFTQEGLRASLAERDALAARLQHQAFHDGLTGLPNRSLYAERLDAALAAGGPVVTMLIDLDDFKVANDEWGHGAGDALLREVALRLKACLRAEDTVACIDSDEGGGSARVGASVGIAVASGHTVDGDSLLREADHAMYAVKRDGKGSYALAPAR